MDYFFLKQDPRYTDVPVIQKLGDQLDPWKLQELQPHDVPSLLMFYIQAGTETRFLDFMDTPLPLMSDTMMKLVKAYVPDTVFKPVTFIHQELRLQRNYQLSFLEKVEALGPSSAFNLDRSVLKKAILSKSLIQGKKIFQVSGIKQTLLAVRLDVAESLLRRDLTGITLERAQLEP